MHFLKLLNIAFLSLLSLSNAADFSNPLRSPEGSDPFLVYTGGYYYLMTTTWSNVAITRATNLEGLKTAPKKVVYSTTEPDRCCSNWAPEVHYLDGKWYIYYTAGTSANLDGQNVHVLTGGATPWDNYTYTGKLTTGWGIDGTVLRFNQPWGNYFVYSCFLGTSLQSLCIAPMLSPTQLGTAKLLTSPTQEWETHRNPVNEGPAALYHGGKTFLVFSGSDCWTTYYALGYLTWNGSGDPTLASSWSKTGPAFSSANGNYGTGHNGFFTSPDGTEIWNIYHATSNVNGACNGERYTMAKKMEWNADGTPNFGISETLGTTLRGPSGE